MPFVLQFKDNLLSMMLKADYKRREEPETKRKHSSSNHSNKRSKITQQQADQELGRPSALLVAVPSVDELAAGPKDSSIALKLEQKKEACKVTH